MKSSRDFSSLNDYLDDLAMDIYPQPMDKVHFEWMSEAIAATLDTFPDIHTVLDVGCGEADAQYIFEGRGIAYAGLCIGEDYRIAKANGKNVSEVDYTFSGIADEQVDLIFARHSLEHSPAPILSLMEWNRISRKYLTVVLPEPAYWGWIGKNHYGVMNHSQAIFLLDRAGWEICRFTCTEQELRYFCSKKERRGDIE